MSKKCPFCAEQIQPTAIVCRHCGRELRGVKRSKAKRGIGYFVGMFVLLSFGGCLFLGILGAIVRRSTPPVQTTQERRDATASSTPRSEHSKGGARNYCHDVIRNALKSPSTAKFPSAFSMSKYVADMGNGRYVVDFLR